MSSRRVYKKVKVNYDYALDILYVRPIKRKYDSSFEMDNFIFDLDNEKKIIGLELLNASKKFKIPKLYLHNLKHIKIEINSSDDILKINIELKSIIRNGERIGVLNVEKINSEHINETNLNMSAVV